MIFLGTERSTDQLTEVVLNVLCQSLNIHRKENFHRWCFRKQNGEFQRMSSKQKGNNQSMATDGRTDAWTHRRTHARRH